VGPAEKLLRDMEKLKLYPKESTINGLVKGLCRAELYDAAKGTSLDHYYLLL
jgi:hypothetical protein